MGTYGKEVAKFEAALNELGFNDLPIERMFELFDQNRDEKIHYREFLIKLDALRKIQAQRRQKQVGPKRDLQGRFVDRILPDR